jgi:hypothetical protein
MRAVVFLILSVLAYVVGCDAPVCGPGTKRVQQADGTPVCAPADAPASIITCDVAGGSMIIGGTCVARLTCGAGTSYDAKTGSCIPSDTSGIPTCPTPSAGHVCVNGSLHDFADGTEVDEKVHVAVYDPLAFLAGAPPLAEKDVTGGSYAFPEIPAPSLQLLAVAVGDKDGAAFVLTGTAANGIVGGQSYRIDGYVVRRALVDGWKAESGMDYFATGAYVGRFFADAAPAPNDWSIKETQPVPGVTLMRDSAAATDARYFGADVAHLDGALTATGAAGAAIVAPLGGSFSTFSGSGGTVMGAPATWQSFPGSSVPNVLFVGRFHRP